MIVRSLKIEVCVCACAHSFGPYNIANSEVQDSVLLIFESTTLSRILSSLSTNINWLNIKMY